MLVVGNAPVQPPVRLLLVVDHLEEEGARSAALAKAHITDRAIEAGRAVVELHGGVGFTWEYDIQLYFKRARSSAVLLGDAAYHRELVAQRIGLGESS